MMIYKKVNQIVTLMVKGNLISIMMNMMNKFKYTIKSQLKNYFIHYYIETFLPRDNFFAILLVLGFFLQTYCSICFFHILFFYFFLLQINFCIYLLLALLIFLYHFHYNLLLYLVSHICFFDNKLNQRNCIQRSCTHSFLYIIKKSLKATLLLTKL